MSSQITTSSTVDQKVSAAEQLLQSKLEKKVGEAYESWRLEMLQKQPFSGKPPVPWEEKLQQFRQRSNKLISTTTNMHNICLRILYLSNNEEKRELLDIKDPKTFDLHTLSNKILERVSPATKEASAESKKRKAEVNSKELPPGKKLASSINMLNQLEANKINLEERIQKIKAEITDYKNLLENSSQLTQRYNSILSTPLTSSIDGREKNLKANAIEQDISSKRRVVESLTLMQGKINIKLENIKLKLTNLKLEIQNFKEEKTKREGKERELINSCKLLDEKINSANQNYIDETNCPKPNYQNIVLLTKQIEELVKKRSQLIEKLEVYRKKASSSENLEQTILVKENSLVFLTQKEDNCLKQLEENKKILSQLQSTEILKEEKIDLEAVEKTYIDIFKEQQEARKKLNEICLEKNQLLTQLENKEKLLKTYESNLLEAKSKIKASQEEIIQEKRKEIYSLVKNVKKSKQATQNIFSDKARFINCEDQLNKSNEEAKSIEDFNSIFVQLSIEQLEALGHHLNSQKVEYLSALYDTVKAIFEIKNINPAVYLLCIQNNIFATGEIQFLMDFPGEDVKNILEVAGRLGENKLEKSAEILKQFKTWTEGSDFKKFTELLHALKGHLSLPPGTPQEELATNIQTKMEKIHRLFSSFNKSYLEKSDDKKAPYQKVFWDYVALTGLDIPAEDIERVYHKAEEDYAPNKVKEYTIPSIYGKHVALNKAEAIRVCLNRLMNEQELTTTSAVYRKTHQGQPLEEVVNAILSLTLIGNSVGISQLTPEDEKDASVTTFYPANFKEIKKRYELYSQTNGGSETTSPWASLEVGVVKDLGDRKLKIIHICPK